MTINPKGPPQLTKSVKFGFFPKQGRGGVEILKKPNFTITIRYEIPTFSSVEPFFEEGGRGSRKVRPETELFGIFSIEVAPYIICPEIIYVFFCFLFFDEIIVEFSDEFIELNLIKSFVTYKRTNGHLGFQSLSILSIAKLKNVYRAE